MKRKKKRGRRRVDRRSSRKKKKERETLPTPRVSPSVGRRWRSRAHSTDKCLQERSYIYSPLLYLSFFSLFLSSLPLSLSLNILSTTVLFCCVRMQVQSCGIHIWLLCADFIPGFCVRGKTKRKQRNRWILSFYFYLTVYYPAIVCCVEIVVS